MGPARPRRSRNPLARSSCPHFRTRGYLMTPIWTNGMSASSSAGPPVCGLDRFSDHDTRILGRARHLPGMPGPAAVRACYGTTAVSYRDTAHAYAGALSQAAWAIGGLLAIIGRHADAGPEALQDLPAGLKEV